MAALVRVARQAELPEGGKLVKETHGRKIMLARRNGKAYATDAHCFHMGGNLWEGDIEDVGGHACVVCPLHRYKIDMATGQKVDTMLDGCVTCSSGQQQRTYTVREDPEHIWLDIPEVHAAPPLPSDRYNQVAAAAASFQAGGYYGASGGAAATPARGNYGLLGSSSRQAAAPDGLAPYSGLPRRGLLPGTPGKGGADDWPAALSQEGLQLSQEAPSQAQQAAFQAPPAQQAQQAQYTQASIPFAQSRVDTARIARRKAATAAIAARSYMPPEAAPLVPARGLASTGAVPQAAQAAQAQAPQQQAPRAAGGLARQASGQASLLNFGFTVQRQPSAAAAGGPDAMDMS